MMCLNRRQFLFSVGGGALLSAGGRALASADEALPPTLIGAAWRGPRPGDPYRAGVLVADWQRRTLAIRHAVPLPTRPHGLLPETGGGLVVTGARPGGWILRCDGDGRIERRRDLEADGCATRFNGHVITSRDGRFLLATETDIGTGRGCIGVRDRAGLHKVDEWDSGGIDPHQLLLDQDGNVMVANGGVPRTAADKKYDLHRMDASLVRLDGGSGRLVGQWRLDDPRLSLRHLVWNQAAGDAAPALGIAMQAEHDDPARRAAAPILAVFQDGELRIPTPANDGVGYAGDIAAAFNGGFVLSSNQAGVAQLWHAGAPERLTPVVEMQEAYALAPWAGPRPGGGVLVATAPGLIRWHPGTKPAFLPWPEPMALDNHWVVLDTA
ncbi:MAG: DUF1513 domain-containing protein [Betaproteobacteria bacterium]|nr:DUF1513 domain-containing protein [Betaproteobacteria bacterium]